MCPSWLESTHWCFFWEGASSNTLPFQKNLEGCSPFLGVPFLLFVSDIFVGGSKVVGEFDVNLRTSWLYIVRSYRRSPLLLTGCWSNLTALVWWSSCRIIIPWFPVQRGLWSSLRECFANASDVPVGLLPDLYLCCSATKKILTGLFTYLRQDLFDRRLYYYYVEEDKIKYR